jgi:hypothetical protein
VHAPFPQAGHDGVADCLHRRLQLRSAHGAELLSAP